MLLRAASDRNWRLPAIQREPDTEMTTHARALIAANCSLFIAIAAGCQKADQPETLSRPTYVLLTYLVGSPAGYNGQLVRVAGYCRIEFEGNGLYVDRETMQSTYGGPKSMWLDVGWPVSDRVRNLNGKFVVVEATVDAQSLGHFGEYRGTLARVRSIEETTLERERGAMLRAMRAPQ